MAKNAKGAKKTMILFVDSLNDLPSQLAEYYTKQIYPDLYEVYSAGPKKDMVDCDMLSVMYCQGDDLRRQVSKDFFDEKNLPRNDPYDYVIYTQKDVYDQLAQKSPWQGRQILVHFGTRDEFTAHDDAELAQDYLDMANRIRDWVKANLDDPEKLKAMVSK